MVFEWAQVQLPICNIRDSNPVNQEREILGAA